MNAAKMSCHELYNSGMTLLVTRWWQLVSVD
jgi:hypothetical protein